MSGPGPEADWFARWYEPAHFRGCWKRGDPMALDINTFLIVFAAVVVVVGLVVWTMFNKVS
jgi:hypothetical protein